VTGKLLEFIIMEGVAAVMLWFAYAIGVRQRMELIAGYNERTAHHVTDKPGLARLVGRMCGLLGLAAAVMPIATWLWGDTAAGLAACIGGFGGLLVGAVGLTVLQARDYTNKGGAGDER
jgi:hypothetical protein